MKRKPLSICLYPLLSLVAWYSGCAGITAVQEWSENYATVQGVEANDPAIIDGNIETIGQSQYLEGSGEAIIDFNAPSESVILLPEPRSIHRIVIHSSNLEEFDIYAMDTLGRWDKIREVKNSKGQLVNLRLRQPLNTASIKIRIRRTSDDAELRRKNVQNMRGRRWYTGRTRAQAKIAEIELYGLASKS